MILVLFCVQLLRVSLILNCVRFHRWCTYFDRLHREFAIGLHLRFLSRLRKCLHRDIIVARKPCAGMVEFFTTL